MLIKSPDMLKDYLFDIKDFLQEFKTGLSQDGKENSLSVSRQENRALDFLPIEIWETKEKYFIQTYLAVIKDLSDVHISIRDGHTLIFKVRVSPQQPLETCWAVHTEYPNFLQREVVFPHTIIYSGATLQNGVLNIVLEKQIWHFESPVSYDKITDENNTPST